MLPSISHRRLSSTGESRTQENQADFRPGRGCVDHIFIRRQIFKHLKHTFRRPMISVFLGLKALLHSIGGAVLCCCLSPKCSILRKFISPFQSPFSNNQRQISAYDDVSPEFLMRSSDRRSCPLSAVLLNFVIKVNMEVASSA